MLLLMLILCDIA